MKEIFNDIIYMARRFKTASTLNLIGLVVAYATCYLLLTPIIYQYTYNHSVDDYQRLYRMESNFLYKNTYTEHMCRPFTEGLKGLPQVESYSLAWNNGFEAKSRIALRGEREKEYLCSSGNNMAVSALTSRVLDGTIEWTDDNQDGIIIPASVAKEYFGTTQAADSVMLFLNDGNPEKERVIGVYEDFPENCELSNYNCIYYNMRDEYLIQLDAYYKCYVKLTEGNHDINAIVMAMKQAAIDSLIANTHSADPRDKNPNDAIEDIKNTDFKLIPLKDSYFEFTSFTTGEHGYRGMLTVLELACLLVIIISTVNFLNFTLAMSPMRIRSLNTRLVLGAQRNRLRNGVITECVFTSLFACLLAIGVVGTLGHVSAARALFDNDFSLSGHWILVACLLVLSVVVGFIAGIYPAIFSTSFQPALVLKSSFGLTPQGKRLRTILVFLQLSASMFMVIYIGLLFQQNRYIYNSAYGYNKNQVLFCPIPYDKADQETLDEICQSLAKNPSISGVSLSSGIIGSTDAHYVIKAESHGHIIGYSFMYTDQHYPSTLGIDIIKGRSFLPGDSAVAIVNESALRQWNWLHMGDKISTSNEETADSATIIGVCKDIRYGTMFTDNSQPYVFILDNGLYTDKLNIRVESTADLDVVIQDVTELLKENEIDSAPVQFNTILMSVYHKELIFFRIIYFLSIICIIITLIGLFCLTMFETEYRRKEIGIRKASGAKTSEIIVMLSRQYVPLVLLSFVLAAPLSYCFYQKTMKPFSQHAGTDWWLFPLSLVLVGCITLATVTLKCWRTARENPSDSLKSE